ncbi:type I DNA topoisomerase [Patescibacteria group bacterium]
MKLVIVESPTKAKTLSKILPKDYTIEASNGHVRDLPKSGLGVDPENNFKIEYEVPTKAKKVISKLKKSLKETDEIILATDPDREGEAIAWHLKYLLTPKKGKEIVFKRAVFHELTQSAIEHAFEKTGEIDEDLVEAQKARRVLDRLVGYKLSPLLWKKVRYGLSAGRVQSVAVRLVVEKEKDRKKFNPEEYWSIVGRFISKDKSEFSAELARREGKPLEVKSKEDVKKIEVELKGESFKINLIKKSERKRKPYAPLKTSTLQQSMANVFGFSAKKTMRAAQGLFEKGYITYHRTDSISLSSSFIGTVRDLVGQEFGKNYLPPKRITYKTKSKSAQEAHEAIRPTELRRLPKGGKDGLKPDEFKTYSMIWKRAVESQMKPVVYDQTTIEILSSDKKYLFRVTGSIVKFPGWYKVGEFLGITESNGNGDENGNAFGKFGELPKVSEGDTVTLKGITSEQHFTQPPARYTDASLIKKLEELGIGRPSTYAPTLSTIQSRGYVLKEGRSFEPTDVAFVVIDLLLEHFPKILDYNFTADMEENLDEVAEGKQEWVPLIREFYGPFEKLLEKKEKELHKADVTTLEKTDEKCPDCGKNLNVKLGKYGKFLSCSDYPECKFAKPLEEDENGDFGPCPECEDGVMKLRRGKFGKFLACTNYPKCKTTQPYLDKIGMECPKCEKGDVVVKKAKKRTFYGCSRYPDCDYSSWKNPMPKKAEDIKKRDYVTSLI